MTQSREKLEKKRNFSFFNCSYEHSQYHFEKWERDGELSTRIFIDMQINSTKTATNLLSDEGDKKNTTQVFRDNIQTIGNKSKWFNFTCLNFTTSTMMVSEKKKEIIFFMSLRSCDCSINVDLNRTKREAVVTLHCNRVTWALVDLSASQMIIL